MVISGICGAFAVYVLVSILVMRQVAVNERAKGVDIGRQGCQREHNAVLVAERTRLMAECDKLCEQLVETERQLARLMPKTALADVYRTVRDEITRIEQQLKTASKQYNEIGESTTSALRDFTTHVDYKRNRLDVNNAARMEFEANVFPTLSAQLEAARKRLLEIAAEVAALNTETVTPATDLTKA